MEGHQTRSKAHFPVGTSSGRPPGGVGGAWEVGRKVPKSPLPRPPRSLRNRYLGRLEVCFLSGAGEARSIRRHRERRLRSRPRRSSASAAVAGEPVTFRGPEPVRCPSQPQPRPATLCCRVIPTSGAPPCRFALRLGHARHAGCLSITSSSSRTIGPHLADLCSLGPVHSTGGCTRAALVAASRWTRCRRRSCSRCS